MRSVIVAPPLARVTKPRKAIRIGPQKIPRRTLGWQVLGWTREYLLQPDGPNASEPWVFTDEQARFVLNWYAIDRDGRFLYDYGTLRRMKGWGKDPVGAALCCVEFVGPCRFGGWENGEPMAVPHGAAWIQTAAVARDQTRNTMTLFPGMLSPKAINDFEIDLGKEIIYADHGRKRIEAVTSSPRALEGGRATFLLKNETHHWLRNNDGHEMSKVIARNAAKSRDGASRVLAITNAHAPGEDSDAEHDWEAYQEIQQSGRGSRFLYDSLEATWPVDMEDDDKIRRALTQARGDSAWLDLERLTAEVRDPRTPVAITRRFYFDQLAADQDRPLDVKRFAELVRKDYKPAPGTLITLGFDGSRNRDWTDLTATEVATGFQWIYGHWEPAKPGPDGVLWVDATAVNETVDDAFSRYKVHRLLADPNWWSSEIAAWEGKYGSDKVLKFPTNSYRRMAVAVLNYRNAIETGALSHDGDGRLVSAVGNCHKQMFEFRDDAGERMYTVQKERPDSPLKIDPAVAAILSWAAREGAIADGALNEEEGAPMAFVFGGSE